MRWVQSQMECSKGVNDATQEVRKQESRRREHQERKEGWQASEASRCHRFERTAQGEKQAKQEVRAQSRRESLLEANVNTWLGMIGSFLITLGCNAWSPNIWWATILSVIGCTIWSLLRGYYVRRYFNKRQLRNVC